MSEGRKVVMYGTLWCGYCAAARVLLQQNNIDFEEIDLTEQPQRRAEMQNLSGRTTVPQIFVGERHIGGYDDLSALERDGRLKELLATD